MPPETRFNDDRRGILPKLLTGERIPIGCKTDNVGPWEVVEESCSSHDGFKEGKPDFTALEVLTFATGGNIIQLSLNEPPD